MSVRPTCLIEWSKPETPDAPYASVVNPRKLIVKSGFGAMPRTCFLELYEEDSLVPLSLGDRITVYVNGTRCFLGWVQELRIDSVDDPVSLVAENDPSRVYNLPVYGEWTNVSVQTWLSQMAPEAGLDWPATLPSLPKLESLTFRGQSTLTAIDLWAKLMGNWRWDITDEGRLRFREPGTSSDHQIHLLRDHDRVNLRKSPFDRYESVTLYAGVIKGAEQVLPISFPENAGRSETAHKEVFARPLRSSDGLFLMREAIRTQMKQPGYSHYIDLSGRGETIQPGDTVRFSIDALPVFPRQQRFRVKRRELTIAHETLTTRLVLTSGYESTYRYFETMLSDPRLVPGYLEGSVGPFQLDVSSLDSDAFLDVA